MNPARPVLVYDGICNLCTTTVRLLYTFERGRLIRYIPYQVLNTRTRRRHGLTVERLQGRMHLIRSNHALVSGAVAIAQVSRFVWPFGFMYRVFETKSAQRVYEWIAGHRYRIFGCRETCYIVEPLSGRATEP